MAKGKSGSVGGGIIGALVLIYLIPREIWIALGIAVVVALAIYFYLQWKAHKVAEAKPPAPAPQYEPTLAELMESRPTRTPPKLPPSASRRMLDTASRAPPTSTGNVREVTQFLAAKQTQQQTNSSPSPLESSSAPTTSDSVILLASAQRTAPEAAAGFKEASLGLGPSGNLEEAKRAIVARQAFPSSAFPPAPPIQDFAWDAERSAEHDPKGEETPLIIVPSPSRPGDIGKTPLPSSITGERVENLQEAKPHLVEQPPAKKPPELPPSVMSVPPALPPTAVATPSPLPSVAAPDLRSRPVEQFHSASISNASASQQFAVPKPPEGAGPARWVGPGERIDIQGVSVPGGMIYIGSRLATQSLATEPSLINGGLTVAPYGDYRSIESSYWHSYTDLSASERRAYLNWLAGGRAAPNCASGYVLIFLYGLERRVLVDGVKEPSSKQDWPAIKDELRRLDALYGETDWHIRGCTTGLLNWMELDSVDDKLYAKPIPVFPKSYELPVSTLR